MTKAKTSKVALSLAALGVVFGDIGTSPLYALQAVFGSLGLHLAVTVANVHGIISLVIWSVMLVVSIKYIGFVMRADNRGEGGIMALVALVKSSQLLARYKWLFVTLGLIGVCLFYGDSMVTPAISVLAAVEGLKVVAPSMTTFVIPITLAVLTLLFWIQRYGTKTIGQLFGPVMFAWFVTIATGGAWRISQHPQILYTLSPIPALSFFINQPLTAFLAMGSVMLAVTGAEALYADMGHFGRPPIARAWFLLVFPALVLCYMGQGALLLEDATSTANSFILLFPELIRIPVILLATVATLIASQSVIAGAFSLTSQAVQLNFLPRMFIRHTSDRQIGQVYLPFVNAALFIGVCLLVVLFGSSEKLANAYGLAVSGTLAIDTILFIVVMRVLWMKSAGYLIVGLLVFLPIDLLFVTANIPKILKGGWVPIVIAFGVFVLINTWVKGQKIVTKERKNLEGTLQNFIEKINHQQPPIRRVPGNAVYISHHGGLAPLALHATVEELHELHENILIVTVSISTKPHIATKDRAAFDSLGYEDDGISHVNLSYGFHDTPDIPRSLELFMATNKELDFDPNEASYFVSLSKIVITKRHNLLNWRKSLYSMMSRNAFSASDYYKLPTGRTVEIRSLIEL